jgi:two-component system sensor histidine kinase EvgS
MRQFHPVRVLLVDDCAALLSTVGRALKAAGHVILVAEDGQAALQQFQPDRFDVVVTDYAMAPLNGLELARAIKELAPEQRVVLLSGVLNELPYGEIPAGVDFLLRKPITLDALVSAITIIATQPLPARTAPAGKIEPTAEAA